ncbi:MAG: hypothetical protein ACRCW1_00575 [Anaerotignaceae bacterium]
MKNIILSEVNMIKGYANIIMEVKMDGEKNIECKEYVFLGAITKSVSDRYDFNNETVFNNDYMVKRGNKFSIVEKGWFHNITRTTLIKEDDIATPEDSKKKLFIICNPEQNTILEYFECENLAQQEYNLLNKKKYILFTCECVL